jgi:hypothetical protein
MRRACMASKVINFTDEHVAQVLPKIGKPLDRYLWLQERAVNFNNLKEETEFRAKFGNFYRI